MDREYADNKSNTGNSARISEMEQGELSYFLKLFEYLRDALNNAPTSFMSRYHFLFEFANLLLSALHLRLIPP